MKFDWMIFRELISSGEGHDWNFLNQNDLKYLTNLIFKLFHLILQCPCFDWMSIERKLKMHLWFLVQWLKMYLFISEGTYSTRAVKKITWGKILFVFKIDIENFTLAYFRLQIVLRNFSNFYGKIESFLWELLNNLWFQKYGIFLIDLCRLIIEKKYNGICGCIRTLTVYICKLTQAQVFV